MDVNKLLLNRAFTAPINSPQDLAHELAGDPTKTYEENDIFTLEIEGKWYFILEADKSGGNRKLTDEKLEEYKTAFGRDKIKTLDSIYAAMAPQEETN